MMPAAALAACMPTLAHCHLIPHLHGETKFSDGLHMLFLRLLLQYRTVNIQWTNLVSHAYSPIPTCRLRSLSQKVKNSKKSQQVQSSYLSQHPLYSQQNNSLIVLSQQSPDPRSQHVHCSQDHFPCCMFGVRIVLSRASLCHHKTTIRLVHEFDRRRSASQKGRTPHRLRSSRGCRDFLETKCHEATPGTPR